MRSASLVNLLNFLTQEFVYFSYVAPWLQLPTSWSSFKSLSKTAKELPIKKVDNNYTADMPEPSN